MNKINFLAFSTSIIISCSAVSADIYNSDGNKLSLYGSMRARHYFSDYTSYDGDASYVRLGFRGQTKISDDLTGYGQWEYQFNAFNAESQGTSGDKTRLGFAGLRYGKLGSIDYGRSIGVTYNAAGITDISPIFDILTDNYTDTFMTSRANNLLTYRNNDFFGLNDNFRFSLQYQGANGTGENNNGRSVYAENGDGVGGSFEWDISESLDLLGAYASSKRTQSQNNLSIGKGDKADLLVTGIKFNDNAYYLAVKYSRGNNITPIKGYGFANRVNNYEIIGKYTLPNGVVPSIGYFYSQGKNIEGFGNVALMKYADFAISYYMNKDFVIYTDYRLNLLNKNSPMGIDTDDSYGMGFTYQF